MRFGGRGWIRWPLGVAAVAAAFTLGRRVVHSGGFFSVAPILLGLLLLIFAAVCFCPEVVHLVALPLTRWIDGLYLPGGRPDPAPLNFRLSGYYERQGQLDLAAAEYRRLLGDYPDEPEVYMRLVRLLVEEVGDQRAARRWLMRGLRRVREPGQRAKLREAFPELL